MKKNHICLAALLASVAFTSCVKESGYENNPAEGSGLPIEFTIPAETKALLDTEDGKTVTFEDGDVVGLFAYYDHDGSGKKTVSPTGKNVPYKYEASTGKFVPVGEPATWGGTSSDEHNLYVYYPYDAKAEGINSNDKRISHTLSTAQVYDATATTSDIVDYGFAWSRLQPAEYGQPVKFDALKQFYSVFRLKIENNTEQDVTVGSVELSVDEGFLSREYDFYLNSLERVLSTDEYPSPKYTKDDVTGAQTITSTVENGEITAGGNIDVRLMIRPADYKANTFTVTVKTDKGDYTTTFGGGIIGAGARASKNIKLVADGGSEEEPAPTQYKVGDTVEGGVLYWISDDNTTGKVLYPKRSTSMVFATENPFTVEGTVNEDDGTQNVAAYKASNPELDKFPAVQFCDALGGGWYLPATNELKLLLGVYNGKTDYDSVTSGTPLNLTLDEKAARVTFDQYLTDLDGDKLNKQSETNNGDIVWTSSWGSSKGKARTVRFGSKQTTYTAVTTTCFARCIKVVNLSATTE